jgi:2-polyprenyl-3-methyl-5-hydroxy-6-metoxy-1,4-benzoquinol methylase
MKSFSIGPSGDSPLWRRGLSPRRRERFADVPCPGCGSTRRRPRFRGKGCRFVSCRDCLLVYQNPQPLFEDLKGRYGQAYFQYELANEENFHRLMELGLADVDFTGRTAGLPPGRRFLDVGCATGRLLESMRGRGWEVRGVDLCPESAAYAWSHRRVEVFAGTLHEARFDDASFQAVHFSHLIEHVPSPRALLSEVRRILEPEGWAVLTTPNVDGLQARLFRGLWRSAIADHLTLFSVRTLRRLLEDCGFRVLAIQTWGGLAKGTAPAWLKGPVDRWAKRRGHGDVVLMLAHR